MISRSKFLWCMTLVFASESVSASTTKTNGTLENAGILNTLCWSCPVKFNNAANSQNPIGAILSGIILTAILLVGIVLLVAVIMTIQCCRTRCAANDVKYRRFNTNLNIGAGTLERMYEKNARPMWTQIHIPDSSSV